MANRVLAIGKQFKSGGWKERSFVVPLFEELLDMSKHFEERISL